MFSTNATLIHKYDSPSGLLSLVEFEVEEKFPLQEGQFVMIEQNINGKIIKRPYSITTTNKDMQEEGRIGSLVKKVSEAGMSDYLTQKITIGDKVKIQGPLGHYVDKQTHANYLFIAVGSGFSPNISLFQHLVYENKKYDNIVNIYGERLHQHIVPKVEKIFTQHGQESIHNFFYLSKEKQPPAGYRHGYVQAGLEEAIQILGTQTSCFICGLPAMVDDVRAQLEQYGINKKDITFEKY